VSFNVSCFFYGFIILGFISGFIMCVYIFNIHMRSCFRVLVCLILFIFHVSYMLLIIGV